MKTNTYGCTEKYKNVSFYIPYYIDTTTLQLLTPNYFLNLPEHFTDISYWYTCVRKNGIDTDSPENGFPRDGKTTFETPNASTSRLMYTEGPKDKSWMEETDRNYVFRLENEGKLDNTERKLSMEVPSLFKEIQIYRQTKQDAAAPERTKKLLNDIQANGITSLDFQAISNKAKKDFQAIFEQARKQIGPMKEDRFIIPSFTPLSPEELNQISRALEQNRNKANILSDSGKIQIKTKEIAVKTGQESVENVIRKAGDAIKGGRWPDAVNILSEAIKRDAENILLYNLRAEVYCGFANQSKVKKIKEINFDKAKKDDEMSLNLGSTQEDVALKCEEIEKKIMQLKIGAAGFPPAGHYNPSIFSGDFESMSEPSEEYLNAEADFGYGYGK